MINAGPGADTVVLGGAGNDSVLGGTDNDSLIGEAGADTISADAGNDTIYGAGLIEGCEDNDSLFTTPTYPTEILPPRSLAERSSLWTLTIWR